MRMVKNEKGFTIIELLAVIVISSIIITPLMFSLVSNVNINALLHIRRSSVSLAEGAIYGFDKLTYSDIELLQDGATDHHLVFDATSCGPLSTNDEAVCEIVFGSEFNNVSFDEDHFKVYIYDYNISQADQNSLLVNASIPQEVRDEIGDIQFSSDPNPGLLRITVWVNYSDDPYDYTVVSGLLIGDWTDTVND